MSEGTISHDAAARLLRMTPSDLDGFVSDGVIPRIARDKFSPGQIIHSYIGYLQQKNTESEKLNQADLARRMDMSERNLRDVLDNLGMDNKRDSANRIITSYIKDLREKAAGRVQSDARERRDLAQAEESEINAAMKRRQLWREDRLILDLETVRQVMSEWATIGKNELLGAVDKMITAIESEHGITVDRDTLQRDVETALRAIGSYSFESPEVDS